LALYALPATTVWPAVNAQVMVHSGIAYEALLVTVTVAPKSGGLFVGVDHETVKFALHEAPVSAGAGGAVATVTATAAPAARTKAMVTARRRRSGLDMHAPSGRGSGETRYTG
jgi:hypothetical protein